MDKGEEGCPGPTRGIETNVCIMHILPYSLCECIVSKSSANNTNEFSMAACCSPGVTHVISEHETEQQSIKALGDKADAWKESTLILNSAWLSECIKAGRLVDVQHEHRLPLGCTLSQV